MKVIKRPRHSGKTTILLHAMVADDAAVMVCRTRAIAHGKWIMSQELGLKLHTDRFISLAHLPLKVQNERLFVDDFDYISRCHPRDADRLARRVSVVTVSDHTSKGRRHE
ncbi:hypothetical protein LCGC14_0343530 [marine sediment metagenome]|uniref:Zona occludens toxin N-terminal domain-containing protein n=1 Tax=marine sediment metagenome TaxID=412755 RepID=A0A0F9TD13_9ZZZZ